MGQVAVSGLINFLGSSYRKRRMEKFIALLTPNPTTRILDIGGTVAFWAGGEVTATITVLNPALWAGGRGPSNVGFVLGDGTATGYADAEFDIVFSNSAIEHLRTSDEQGAMAEEIRRVGRAYWVQTPCRWFPLDGHLIAPFVHWLPRTLYRLLAPVTPYALLSRSSAEHSRAVVDEIRFVSLAELRHLFPDALILREKAFGMTKSYVAVRR